MFQGTNIFTLVAGRKRMANLADAYVANIDAGTDAREMANGKEEFREPVRLQSSRVFDEKRWTVDHSSQSSIHFAGCVQKFGAFGHHGAMVVHDEAVDLVSRVCRQVGDLLPIRLKQQVKLPRKMYHDRHIG
jgi:hypothetical protein